MKHLKRILFILCLTATPCLAQQGAWVRVNDLAEAVSAPKLYTLTNGLATLAFGTNESTISGKTLRRTLQNTGTNPVIVRLWTPSEALSVATNLTGTNASSSLAATNHHFILPPGTLVRDGRSAPFDISWWRWGIYVAVLTNGNSTLASEVLVVEGTQ